MKQFKEFRRSNYEVNAEYLVEGKTTASTYFEQVIVACANSDDIKEVKSERLEGLSFCGAMSKLYDQAGNWAYGIYV